MLLFHKATARREASRETSSRETSTRETSRELHLFLNQRLDARLPVLVEAGNIAVKEGKAVCQPLLQHGNFLVIAADTIGCKHIDHGELLEIRHGTIRRETTAKRWETTAKRKTALRAVLPLFLKLLFLLLINQEFRVSLEMMLRSIAYQLRMTVDVGIKIVKAKQTLA